MLCTMACHQQSCAVCLPVLCSWAQTIRSNGCLLAGPKRAETRWRPPSSLLVRRPGWSKPWCTAPSRPPKFSCKLGTTKQPGDNVLPFLPCISVCASLARSLALALALSLSLALSRSLLLSLALSRSLSTECGKAHRHGSRRCGRETAYADVCSITTSSRFQRMLSRTLKPQRAPGNLSRVWWTAWQNRTWKCCIFHKLCCTVQLDGAGRH